MSCKLILPILTLTLGLATLTAAPMPCTTATLSAYVGAAACSIGSVVVSDFTLLPNPSGDPVIGAANITVTPTASTYTQTLEFRTSTSATGSLLGASFEQIFTYLVSPLGAFTNASLSLLDSSASIDGVVVGTQFLCQGGALSANGSSCATTGDFFSNSVLAIDGGTPDLLSASFALSLNASALFVRNEFVIDGGTEGTASAGALTNSFTAVPEPATLSLVGSLLLGAAFFGRRKSA